MPNLCLSITFLYNVQVTLHLDKRTLLETLYTESVHAIFYSLIS